MMQTQLSYLAHIPYHDTDKLLYTEFLLLYQSFVEIKKKEEEEMKKQEQKQKSQMSQMSLGSRSMGMNRLSNLNFGG